MPDKEILTCNDGNCNNEQTIEDLRSRVSELDTRYWKLLDRYKASCNSNSDLSLKLKKGIDRTVEAYDSLGNRCFEEILMILMNKDEEYVLNAMISFRAMKDWQNEKR